MELYDHQKEISAELQELFKREGVAILSLPERSGKTLTAIDALVKIGFRAVLWVTKKNGIKSIESDLSLYGAQGFTVTNYESLHKVDGKFDVIVLDESHTCASFPKPSVRYKELQKFRGVPFLFISATPAAESSSQWYHQLSLSVYHKFSQYRNFYAWAKDFVYVTQKRINGFTINDYSKGRDDLIMQYVTPYIIKRSREDLGFEFEPNIVQHIVPLDDETKKRINTIRYKRVFGDILFDTPVKVINGIYQSECGTLKDGDKYHDFGNREFVNYIKSNWGDNENVAIMSRWVGEKAILDKEFKHAHIFSSIAHAEGIEMAHIEHLIISSLDYSTARFQQRNARQASKKRTTPINVHILMSENGVSKKVYEAVAVKGVNFTARMAL